MQRGRYFEKEIEKVIEKVEKLGYHGHKNHADRLEDGTYIKGEAFDYEILVPYRHDCFDAKEVEGDTWHIVAKDIKQANELKKCKNAGCKAYFLVFYKKTSDVKMIDVDIVIDKLSKNIKFVKNIDLPNWSLINYIKDITKLTYKIGDAVKHSSLGLGNIIKFDLKENSLNSLPYQVQFKEIKLWCSVDELDKI